MPGQVTAVTRAAPAARASAKKRSYSDRPILARRESGRDLFVPAKGREVLVWGAWRTAWMAGYFYNDGKVREVPGLAAVVDAAGVGPVLVLAGPAEARRIAELPTVATLRLAEDYRGDALLRVSLR